LVNKRTNSPITSNKKEEEEEEKEGEEEMKTHVIVAFFLALVLGATKSEAGPGVYAICQTGCNAVVVACYSSAGAVFGTVTAGLGVAPAIMGCNTALGVCMAACVAAGCTPTP